MSRKDEKTLQIFDASIDEFLKKGFDASSMHNIAKEAQVSKRTLYKYFPTKEALYNNLIDETLENIKSLYDFPYSKEKSITEQVSVILDRKIKLTLNPFFLNLSKIVLAEMLKGRSPSLEQLEKIANSEQLFLNWIIAAQEDKKLKVELTPEIMANQFHSILKGQIYWPVLLGFTPVESLDLELIKKTTLDFFINSFAIS